MATFAGVQPGYPDPTMKHEGGLKVCTETFTFKGVQAGYPDPTIAGCIPWIEKEK